MTKRAKEIEAALDLLEPVLAPMMADANRFVILTGASFLEGTLRFPNGRTVRFEWDADSGGPDLRALLDELVLTEAAKQKARAAFERGDL